MPCWNMIKSTIQRYLQAGVAEDEGRPGRSICTARCCADGLALRCFRFRLTTVPAFCHRCGHSRLSPSLASPALWCVFHAAMQQQGRIYVTSPCNRRHWSRHTRMIAWRALIGLNHNWISLGGFTFSWSVGKMGSKSWILLTISMTVIAIEKWGVLILQNGDD
jgi:hypothetical protein